MQQILQEVRIQLVSAAGTTDLWQDTSPWMPTLGVAMVRGTLTLCDKLGNFRFRIGIQTTPADIEIVDVAVNPSDATNTGTGYITALGRNFFNFDPTRAGNGNISTKGYFRLGLLYSSTDATVGRGDVILKAALDM